MSRRQFLGATLATGGATLAGLSPLRVREAAALDARPEDPFAGGRLLGTLPLSGRGGVDHPLETLLGEGLDARLATDLSTLTPETLVIPNERFFVRTDAPPALEAREPWTIRLQGLVRRPRPLRLDSLTPRVAPMGTHLVECAGNANPANFGLMSAASWEGVPLSQVLELAQPLSQATRVLVSGLDPRPGRSRRSVPGASWILSLAEIERWRPFLATRMNGAPLSRAHGAPVRLLVPRWYGCASIKWVDGIRLVDDREPATPHMREFARRTHQEGIPDLACDFASASVDLAAMPVRVEKWLVDGALRYRIVGVVWGGERPSDVLQIGFEPDGGQQRVLVRPPPTTTDTWALWSHRWRPAAPGRYKIVLRAVDPAIRTRRLDLYYYIREVRVDEI